MRTLNLDVEEMTSSLLSV